MSYSRSIALFILATALFSLFSCGKDEEVLCEELTWYQDSDGDGLGNPDVPFVSCEAPSGYVSNAGDPDDTVAGNEDPQDLTTLEHVFEGRIDLNNLANYAAQFVPVYINSDNTGSNPVTDAGATLGRVLFYDKNLSVDNTISCSSCHKQEFAFGDTELQSEGVAGLTGRHSMRLINARFANEFRFFWDERAGSLEEQSTMPIRDHVEMGFSGQNGDPGITDLIAKLENLTYYRELFTFVYGDASITEDRMREALAQFVRSIQSFDSRYDQGRGMVNNNTAPFPNFTPQENMGKNLFTLPANQGGAGCAGCHRPPAFDIDPNTRNNGVVGVAGDPTGLDTDVTRSPTLRDLINPDGQLNGPWMHDGSLTTLEEVIEHYNNVLIVPGNDNLDPRLRAGGPGNPGMGQQLELSDDEKAALVAFLHTLSGNNVYTDLRWSDPFGG